MYNLILQGNYLTFAILLVTIVFALCFHEFAHAASARYFGDRTAEQQGRLTLNPISHIDPVGLLMVVIAGFGWARPVPTNPRNFNSKFAMPLIAAAGPASNLLLAFLTINLYVLFLHMGFEFASTPTAQLFVSQFVFINVILMLFNLIPLGPLDGHYILPYFLSNSYARAYIEFNQKYGTMAFLGLIMLSIVGLPIFGPIRDAAQWIIPRLQIL